MEKKMLIDASHPEETRVVVLSGARIEDFDYESSAKKQLRGNIYLAKVTRVEPSLQAAFVEYGGNRHGFLAFNEIHPDYYQIPVADREALLAEERAAVEAENDDEDDDDDAMETQRRRRQSQRRYKIQEVIKRRQIMLIQVVKEERGNKGAALTTYLSLAGRYCVLMPNTARGGGISRKIPNGADRKRLKKVAGELEIPNGMGLIIRTAGAKRTKTEIKRDYEYLLRLWELIRDDTMKAVAPKLIHEEGSLVKRALRDLYDKDVESIVVEGDSAYKEAKEFVKMLMPSHARKVQQQREGEPLFLKHRVEEQLESIYSPVVHLRSGGSIVINQTEALVAIDVNSGRATRERSIESTALKTNLEAAEEAARQMRLRDLAGLVVIDFIDMEEQKNDRIVEKKMQDCLRHDRARVQMGKISSFGLLEISRQRRRTGVLEGSSHICEHCAGSGRVRSIESCALRVLRTLEHQADRIQGGIIDVDAPVEVSLYLLNQKRAFLAAIEARRGALVRINAIKDMQAPDFNIRIDSGPNYYGYDEDEAPPRERASAPAPQPHIEEDVAEEAFEDEAPQAASSEQSGQRRRRRRRRRGGGGEQGGADANRPQQHAQEPDGDDDSADDGAEPAVASDPQPRDGEEPRRSRRRRGRRGGRRRREEGEAPQDGQIGQAEAQESAIEGDDFEEPYDDAPTHDDFEPEDDVEIEATPAPQPARTAEVATASYEIEGEPESSSPTVEERPLVEATSEVVLEHSPPVIEVSAENPIRRAFDPTHWKRIIKGS
ncbi:MAG: Rne/Rng family ribonuclease [Caulobacterales bacterium]